MESSYDKPKPTAQEGLALRVTSGRDEGKVFPLVEGFVGKQASCDVRLTDPALSGMHARISLRRNVWFITDLTSAPDIRVNNNVVKSRKIQYGDTIVICNTTLQVVNAPAGLEKPRKIETKRSPAVKTGAPPSQTMEISLDHKVEGWTHNKPTPKKKKASDKHAATSRTRKESEPALNTDELEKYRSKSFQQDDVAEKSGVRMMVWILILVAIVAPLLVGGLHLSNKRREKHELSMTYAATQEFERQNPANYEAIIDEYRKLEMTATGSDNRIALMARENIDRIQLEAKANEPALKTALVPLDQNAEAFAAGGSFAKAADVYENYAGKMKTQVLAARADEISKLKALASKQAPEPPKVDTAAKPVAPTPPSKTLLAAKALDAKLKTIVASAVDSAIKGDIALAIAELGKITADPALAVNYKLAEQAILSLTLLETVDRTVKASTVKGNRIFVGPDIKLGTQLIPLMVKEEAAVIYASNFTGEQAPGWKSNSGRVYTERGDLRLDTSPVDDNDPPAGAPNVWFEANLPDQPATIEILLLKEDDSEFAVILDKLQFVLSGSKERPAGTWFDGHMIEAHKLPILPVGIPLPLKISWTPLSTTVTIGTSTMTASVDTTRRSKGLATIGFITRGKSTVKELTITREAVKTGPRVLGINESGTTAIISRGSSAGWSSLQPGHSVFLLNKNAPPAKLQTVPPVWESMQATVVDVGAELIICAIGKNGGSIGSSTIASLTKTLRSTEEADSPDTPHYMTASGWYPEAIYATIGNDSKGEPFLIPDLPCAYAPRGFASEVSDTITHPYTLEPFVAFPTRTQAADFSERAGTLRFPALPTLTSKEGERCRILLTALAPTENAIIPLTPPSFPILPLTAARSPQGWNVVGDWKDKFGRLMSPLKGGELPVAASQAFLWENCQYSVDVKIESPSTDEKLAELVVEVYSPFWKKGLALITGTHGSTISFDSIRNKGEAYSLKQSSFAPSPGLTRNGQFSIMKTEKVITGQLSKTVLLRRIAVGSVTDMTSRIARGATSAPSEPIQDGMKVMAGLQPETLTMTSERLSSVDDGL